MENTIYDKYNKAFVEKISDDIKTLVKSSQNENLKDVVCHSNFNNKIMVEVEPSDTLHIEYGDIIKIANEIKYENNLNEKEYGEAYYFSNTMDAILNDVLEKGAKSETLTSYYDYAKVEKELTNELYSYVENKEKITLSDDAKTNIKDYIQENVKFYPNSVSDIYGIPCQLFLGDDKITNEVFNTVLNPNKDVFVESEVVLALNLIKEKGSAVTNLLYNLGYKLEDLYNPDISDNNETLNKVKMALNKKLDNIVFKIGVDVETLGELLESEIKEYKTPKDDFFILHREELLKAHFVDIDNNVLDEMVMYKDLILSKQNIKVITPLNIKHIEGNKEETKVNISVDFDKINDDVLNYSIVNLESLDTVGECIAKDNMKDVINIDNIIKNIKNNYKFINNEQVEKAIQKIK